MLRSLLSLGCVLGLLHGQEAHWAFAALGSPDEDPMASEAIDRLVERRRRSAGLTGNPPADRRTLLRRAAFVLTGLPPGADELAAFAADPSPDAFATAVDRLLASPHYGEHQARLWLDLARYSDSNGLDENLAYAEAFRYRDWVVRACNADLPFDRFATLQLAGDLVEDAVPGQALDRYTATAFLALGPKMLAEQDKEKLVLDVVDEQIDLVGRTFLGLTLGCARCHDHKFDPVPARDYYALAGIFRSTKTLEDLGHVSRWLERDLADDAAIAQRTAAQRELAAAEDARKEAMLAATAQGRARLAQNAGSALLDAMQILDTTSLLEAEAACRTSLRRDDRQWGSADCVVLHTHQGGVQFAEWQFEAPSGGFYAVHVRLAAKEARPMRLSVDGQQQIERTLDVATGGWLPEDQRWCHAGDLQLAAGTRLLRLEALGPHVPHLDCLFVLPVAKGSALPAAYVLGAAHALLRRDVAPLLQPWRELAPLADADLAARAAALRDRDAGCGMLLGGLLPVSRRDLAVRYEALFSAAARLPEAPMDPVLGQAHRLLFGPAGWLVLPDPVLAMAADADLRQRLAELDQLCAERRAALPPEPARTLCVAEGSPLDLPVHLRGSHLSKAGHPVPRGFLGVLAAVVPPPVIPPDQSGRLQLAEWLFDRRNPLPARVLANRVWQQLFGHGLSRTPSNFGCRGEPPSHPELLDLLARSLLEDGWSVKRLQRRILLSATWQQSSSSDDSRATIDPDNTLLWRQHLRRLPAEAIRDAMLVAAGTLDPTMGGSLLGTRNRDYVTNDQSDDRTRYDAPRRSLYLPVVRNAMYDLFTAFDYADPSVHLEQRPSSAVATQALLLLNSRFALQQAAAFAQLALQQGGDDDARVAWIWQRALQRHPQPAEAAAARAFLDRTHTRAPGATPNAPWRSLCQALLASNEFLHID